ncbi:MAG: hypothetical protein P8K80_05915 [Phycisphaerales bacterium]|nr:hypothetical protein [Phycisphaerales bacterium]
MNRRLLILMFLVVAGCGETRTQYRKMPAFYQQMAGVDGGVDGRTRDGMDVRWVMEAEGSLEGFNDHTGKPFLMREEREDGTISLNALIPEHVLLSTLDCVRNQEYQLLWDELVAEETRTWYEEEGGGFEACDAFFRVNRRDIVATLARMQAGMASQEMRRIQISEGRWRLQLIEQLHPRFRYTSLETAWDGKKYRLVTIQ